MKVSAFIEQLEGLQDANISRRHVINVLNTVDPERDLVTVDKLRAGDTFFYKVTGGKSRPWLVLFVRKGLVGAASLTHSELTGGYKAQCRFWQGNYIGPTLTIVEEEKVKTSVYYPYTNKNHLKEIRDNIRKVWK